MRSEAHSWRSEGHARRGAPRTQRPTWRIRTFTAGVSLFDCVPSWVLGGDLLCVNLRRNRIKFCGSSPFVPWPNLHTIMRRAAMWAVGYVLLGWKTCCRAPDHVVIHSLVCRHPPASRCNRNERTLVVHLLLSGKPARFSTNLKANICNFCFEECFDTQD